MKALTVHAPKERPILMSGPMVRATLDGRKTQTRRMLSKAYQEFLDQMEGRDDPEFLQSKDPSDLSEITLQYGTDGHSGPGVYVWASEYPDEGSCFIKSPYGVPRDRLWVKETHAQFAVGEGPRAPVPRCVAYRATCEGDGGFDYVNGRGEFMRLQITKWTPSIFMPRWASRITLDIKSVSVERLQGITEEDAIAEGVAPLPGQSRADGCWWTADVSAGPKMHAPSAVGAFRKLWIAINGEASWEADPWVWRIAYERLPMEAR